MNNDIQTHLLIHFQLEGEWVRPQGETKQVNPVFFEIVCLHRGISVALMCGNMTVPLK